MLSDAAEAAPTPVVPTTLYEKVRQELDDIRSAGLSYDGIVADFDHVIQQGRSSRLAANGYAQMLREYMSQHRIYTDHAAELLDAAIIEARSTPVEALDVTLVRELVAALDAEIALHPYEADAPTSVIEARNKGRLWLSPHNREAGE